MPGVTAWAAIPARPMYGKAVSGPIPLRPSTRPVTSESTSGPSAVRAPVPVIATAALRTRLLATLGGDELDQRVHRREGALADLLVRDRDLEPLLDEHHQLQRVDRIEPEAVPEDRCPIGDRRRVAIEAEPGHQKLLHIRPQLLSRHFLFPIVSARGRPPRDARGSRPRAPTNRHRRRGRAIPERAIRADAPC